MPHPSVKTIRDLIYWEYAKLISGSTLGNRKNWGFIMHIYQRLKNQQMKPSGILRENKKFFDSQKLCAYCNSPDDLEWEHIIPRAKIDIDTLDNQVLACKSCNCAKGGRDPFEWYGLDRKYEIPRLVLGKYLKLIYEIHEKNGALDKSDLNQDGKLDIYDLGVIIPEHIDNLMNTTYPYQR